MSGSKTIDATQGLTDRQQIERLIKGHFNEFDQRQEWFKSHAEAVAKLIATEFAVKIGQQLSSMSEPGKILLSMPVDETVKAASMQVTGICKISQAELVAKVRDNLRALFSEIDARILF